MSGAYVFSLKILYLKKKTRNDNTKWTLLNNVNNKLTNRKIYRKQSFYTGMLGKMLLVRTGVKFRTLN